MRSETSVYLTQIQALLPVGGAWPRDAGATLTSLLTAVADEMARIHNRSADLVEESDPRGAVELIQDWETETGLPDACMAEVATVLQERRAAVHAKLTGRGGQSPAFYIGVAAALGFDITITEFRPFRAGMNAAGDAVRGFNWWHAWRVNAPETTIVSFRAGSSAAGEPLRTWGNELLECAISRLKPAHTIVIFAYGG